MLSRVTHAILSAALAITGVRATSLYASEVALGAVAITSPAHNQRFDPGKPIAVAASATGASAIEILAWSGDTSTVIARAAASSCSGQWTPPAPGRWFLIARGTDAGGNYALSPLRWIYSRPATAQPFGPTRVIPGTVQIEDFDMGGEGVAYHEDQRRSVYASGPDNENGAYERDDGPDISFGEMKGGFTLGAVAPEWLRYTIKAQKSGSYDVAFWVANGEGANGRFHLEIDGKDVTGPLLIPLGSWFTYVKVAKSGVSISEGIHVARVVMDANSTAHDELVGNFDRMEFTLSGATVPAVTFSTPVIDYYKPTVFGAGQDITLGAEATSSAGIEKVEFYAWHVGPAQGDPAVVLGTATASPFVFVWKAVPEGAYAVVAQATDRNGLVTISEAKEINVYGKLRPFGGAARVVPGTLEMEHYDHGGPTVAYVEAPHWSGKNKAYPHGQKGNSIGRCNEFVDLETWSAGTGVAGIGGEWYKYSVFVAQAGIYSLEVLANIAEGSGGNFRVEVDGAIIMGSQTVPDAGTWFKFGAIRKTGIALSRGAHVVRFVCESNKSNGICALFDKMVFNLEKATGIAPQPTMGHRSIAQRRTHQIVGGPAFHLTPGNDVYLKVPRGTYTVGGRRVEGSIGKRPVISK